MALTQQQLGERLAAARERSGLTQQQVADGLGIPRSAVSNMETGARSVTGLELIELSKLYHVDVKDLIEGTDPREELTAMFRMDAVLQNDPSLQDLIRRTLSTCETITAFEEMLHPAPEGRERIELKYPAPTSKLGAVEEGRGLARLQRERLGLGFAPIEDLPALILRQGIAVANHNLPNTVSGIFLRHARTRPFILINESHNVVRQRFSLAHEFCHALVDHQARVLVSYQGDDTYREVRANAFAAAFLLPREAIVEHASEANIAPPEWDHTHVSILAHQYGLSYESTVHHLRNLRFISLDKHATLLAGANEAAAFRINHLPERDAGAQTSLREWALSLVFDAYEQQIVSKRKALEIVEELGYRRNVVGQMLETANEPLTNEDVVA